jgi:hypothetical protein
LALIIKRPVQTTDVKIDTWYWCGFYHSDLDSSSKQILLST